MNQPSSRSELIDTRREVLYVLSGLTAVAGLIWFALSVFGATGTAGTLPMIFVTCALMTASQFGRYIATIRRER